VQHAEKPRRSRAEELAEIDRYIAGAVRAEEERWRPIPPAVNPSLALNEIVDQLEADEEAAFLARERTETPEEREEAARLLAIEAEIAAEVPLLRERELRKTFSRPPRVMQPAL
jgi:hypothetical protein